MATQILFFSSRTLGKWSRIWRAYFSNGVGSTYKALRKALQNPCRVAGCHVGARILLVASVLEDWCRQIWFKGKNGKSKCTVVTSIEGCSLNEHWWYPVISWKDMKGPYQGSVSHQLVLIMTKIWHQNYATTLFPVPRTRQKSSTWQKTWHGTSEGNSWNMGW